MNPARFCSLRTFWNRAWSRSKWTSYVPLGEWGEPAAGLFPFLAALLLIVTSLLARPRASCPTKTQSRFHVIAYYVALALFCVLPEVLGLVAAALLFLSESCCSSSA